MRHGVGRVKAELYEFAISKAFGLDHTELAGFSQRMPHGQIVYGPKNIPKHMRPMFEGHNTNWHRPELHARYSPVFASAGIVAAPVAVAVFGGSQIHVAHKQLEPAENKSSWWRSIAQAIGPGGVGIGTAGSGWTK